MRVLFPVMLIMVCGLMSGCVTSGDAVVSDVTKSEQFKQTCKALPLAYAGYTVVKARVTIDPKIDAYVQAAYTNGRRTCANPPSDLATALADLTQWYDSILNSSSAVANSAKSAAS